MVWPGKLAKAGFLTSLLAVPAFLIGSCSSSSYAGHSETTQGKAVTNAPLTAATDPPDFLYMTNNGTMEFRSPRTGALVRVIADIPNLTGNGASLSTDGKNAYVAVIDKADLETQRVRTQTGTSSLEVDGLQAAVSGDGKFLAYTPGPNYDHLLSIKDLATGSTSTLNLASLLGGSTDLMNGTITWLGDGSDLVVMPSGVATATTARRAPGPASRSSASSAAPASDKGTCSASLPRTSVCLVLVHFAGPGQSLTARRVVVNGVGGNVNVISGAQGQQHTLALAAWGGNTTVYWISFSGSGTNVTRLASLGPDLPVAFDALGTHLLYVAGNGPVALWVTAFKSGHPADPHRLLDSSNMSEVVW